MCEYSGKYQLIIEGPLNFNMIKNSHGLSHIH